MVNKLKNDWASQIIFIILALMIIALFVSRALLSITLILFVITTLFSNPFSGTLNNFRRSLLLTGMTLLFFLPFISGLWSEDSEKWLDIVRIKLPLIVLPFAFAGNWRLTPRQWLLLGMIFIAMITFGTIWSTWQYFQDPSLVEASYLKGKTLPSPLENDHVRFSWIVFVGMLSGSFIAWKIRGQKGLLFWMMIVLIILLCIYLHLLAARTGLLSFYAFVGAIIVWLFSQKNKRRLGISLLMFLLILSVTAYFLMPSLRNRIRYMRYDYEYFSKGHYLPGGNDAVRLISIRAGWEIMNDHPLKGVGFGDIHSEMKKKYAELFPAMRENDKILPGSEWMMYGSGCGWAGFIIFTACMVVPFLVQSNHKLLWWVLNITAAFSLLFDIGLEVQFGTFIYPFVVLCFWKSFKDGV